MPLTAGTRPARRSTRRGGARTSLSSRRTSPSNTGIHAESRQWLRTFEDHVRAVDLAAARDMFAADVVAFGTYAAIVPGRTALERRQWAKVWPAIRGFRFRIDAMRSLGGPAGICVVVPWDSRGVRPDGSTFPRPGRATLFLVKRGRRWVAAHSHFSLAPTRARSRPRR